MTSSRVLEHRRWRRRLRLRLREVRHASWVVLGGLLAAAGVLAVVVIR